MYNFYFFIWFDIMSNDSRETRIHIKSTIIIFIVLWRENNLLFTIEIFRLLEFWMFWFSKSDWFISEIFSANWDNILKLHPVSLNLEVSYSMFDKSLFDKKNENITIDFPKLEFHEVRELKPRLLQFEITTVDGRYVESFDKEDYLYLNIRFEHE